MNNLSSVVPAASVISLGQQVAGGSMGVNPWKSPNDTSSSEHAVPVNR